MPGAKMAFSGAESLADTRDKRKNGHGGVKSSRRRVIRREGVARVAAMHGDTAALPVGVGWLARMRQRGLFVGMSYALAVTLGLMVAWDLDMFVWSALEHGIVAACRESGFFFIVMAAHQLPSVPLLTISINLAPPSGVRRYLQLVATLLLMWGFCTLFFVIEGDYGWNLQGFLMQSLIVAACVYRSSARTAASRLMQREIEDSVLDADVKRARLQLLRAQIEPHFLFNTLATIRTLARIDLPAAVDMIDNLMRYLSEALPKLRQEESSLADELQLIDAYLRIHQIRMGTRLSYELMVPDDLCAERIPTMILLTLVENAVKHGINPAVEGGSIRVSASRERETLVLKVADSGQGLAATDGHGLGLANIRRRLAMLYGDAAILSLSRLASRGTVATVSIPMGSV
jgi:sensor histidine kinase YesM